MSKYTPFRDQAKNGGTQQVYKFSNGYGASVVRGPFTYGGDRGLFELGVLKFKGDEWSLTYDTPITDDVCGYLDPDEVEHLLNAIQALPEAA